jgi:hypothetical protein
VCGSCTNRCHSLRGVTGSCSTPVRHICEFLTRILAAIQEELQGPSPIVVPFSVRQVTVECFGKCADLTLGQACGFGWTPIAVDCQNVQEWTGVACGDNNRCARFLVLPTDRLSDYCDDNSAGMRIFTVPDRVTVFALPGGAVTDAVWKPRRAGEPAIAMRTVA